MSEWFNNSGPVAALGEKRHVLGSGGVPKPVDAGDFKVATSIPTAPNLPVQALGESRRILSESSKASGRIEFHFKSLDLDDEDELELGSFKKRTEKFEVGARVRWLKMAKTFVITKVHYMAKGVYLIHGEKDNGAGTIMGFFSPSELAVLPA